MRTLAHTAWRLIPPGLRRSLLHKAAALLAARPATGPVAESRAAAPFIVVGPIDTASGIGAGARHCLHELQAAGATVGGIDIGRWFLGGDRQGPVAFQDARDWTGPGTLILHMNAPLVPVALATLGRDLVSGKKIIGYCAWELPDLPPAWRAACRFMHEVWVPSAFNAEAFRRAAPRLPVTVVPHPVAAPDLPGRSPPADGRPFTVLTLFNMGSGFVRKNPLAAIRAFLEAFGDDPGAQLVVKTHHTEAYADQRSALRTAVAGRSNVRLIDHTLSRDELNRLMTGCDVLLSLHRSEGFGLPLAEAMASGIPVVATGWSGNLEFMTPDTAGLVAHALVPAADPGGPYHHPEQLWAEPDVRDAARWLRRLREHPDEARAMAERAREHILADFSAEAWLRRVRERLDLPS
ncbi:glycosyltransferase involved in cell wall biosynthesis [Azospirillum baldaniorum]|uniref:glycosyltransferase family 4 protein n=1 Tax=Azospirillum baldaniorum TaxID=1064539 RepID=UPI0011ADC6B1|nr:glycosyltransferase family 4 protein [Azospirillum baldaniorum]TWA53824.1 glycosyltransferase involved in cell wall biosynthesis [Azospirillum baldaniorum]